MQISNSNKRDLVIKAFNPILCMGVAALILSLFLKGSGGSVLAVVGLVFFILGFIVAFADLFRVYNKMKVG